MMRGPLVEYEAPVPLRDDEFVCDRCHLIHLKAAGSSACDEV